MFGIGGGGGGGGGGRLILIALGIWASVMVGGLYLVYCIGGGILLGFIVGALAIWMIKGGVKLAPVLRQGAAFRSEFIKMSAAQREEFLKKSAGGRGAATGAKTANAASGWGAFEAQQRLGALRQPLSSKLHHSVVYAASSHSMVRSMLKVAPTAKEHSMRAQQVGFTLAAADKAQQPTDGGLILLAEELFELHPTSGAGVMIAAKYTLRLSAADLAAFQQHLASASFRVGDTFTRDEFRRIATLTQFTAIRPETSEQVDLLANMNDPEFAEDANEGPVKEAEYEEIRRR